MKGLGGLNYMDDYNVEEIVRDPFSELELELTRNEALFLDDSITLMIEQDIHDGGKGSYVTSLRPAQQTAGIPVPMDLIEKVGRAVLFTTDPQNETKTYTIKVDHSELYMIREVASSFIKLGEEPVGYNLKVKISRLLFAEDLEKETQTNLISKLLTGIEGLDSLEPEPVPESDEKDID